MDLQTAVGLIEKGVDSKNTQAWADLGAGDGLFTKALSKALPRGSSIVAIDKNSSSLSKIQVEPGIQLQTKALDFVATALALNDLDGILMANSLHYVKDQAKFLSDLKKHLKPSGRFIIVEYNTDRWNQWVPYAISFETLQSLNAGDTIKLADAPSAYHKEGMYAAQILP